MHPVTQQLPYLLQITPRALRPHTNQPPGIPTRRYDPLRPYPPHLIVRQEGIVDAIAVRDLREHRPQDERVLDGLSGSLALVWRRGVRGVAHHGDAAFCVGRRGTVVPHCPDAWLGGSEKELGMV